MALSITRARIKEKCGIADGAHDTVIDNLIAELGPVIEHAIRAEHIAETSNAGLQATLNLGATEIVGAEFLDQLARAPGASEFVAIGGISLTPNDAPARTLRGTGWRRLRPFLKADPSGATASTVLSAGGKQAIQENSF